MVYFVIVFILLILVYKYDYLEHETGKNFWFFFVLLYFILLAGLRYRVGMDTIIYMTYHRSWPDIYSIDITELFTEVSKFQPLWLMYVALLGGISRDFVLLQFTNAIFLNTVILYFLRGTTKYLFTAIFFYAILYYLEFNFEILREAISIGFLLLAIPAYHKNKWLSYYVLTIVAYGFHGSAGITFLFPLMKLVQVNYKTVLFLFVVPLLSTYIVGTLSGLPSKLVALYLYLYSDFNYLANLNLMGYMSYFLMNFILPIGLVFYYKKLTDKDFKFEGLIYLMVVVGMIALELPILNRLRNYMYIFYAVLLAEIVMKTIKSPRITFKMITVGVIVFLLVFRIYTNMTLPASWRKNDQFMNYSRYYPYYTILEPKKDPVRVEECSEGSSVI